MDIFKLVGSVFVDTAAANDSLSKTDEQAEKTGGKLASMGKVVATAGIAIGAACVAAGAAIWGVAKESAAASDEIDKMSQRLGVSRQAYQELDFALSQSGVDINSFQTGMKSLLKNMDGVTEGNKTATANFEKLGVAVQNADGTMRSQEDVLFDTIQAFQGMEESSEKARLAQEMFGKQGQEIMPLLNSEGASIEELRQQAQDLGLVLGDDVIDAGVEFTDTMDQLKRSFGSIVQQIGGAFLPMLNTGMQFIISNMPLIKSVMEKVFGAIRVVVDAVIVVFGKLKDWFGLVRDEASARLGPVIDALKEAFNNVKDALQPVIDLVKNMIEKWKESHSPMQTASTFVTILSGVIQVLTGILNGVAVVIRTVVTVVSTFVSAIKTGIDTVKSFYNTVKSTFDSVYSTIKSVIDKVKNLFHFTWSLPSIKMPHFKITPSGWKIGDLLKGSIPKLGIDWYAKAMDEARVLDKPTIFGMNDGQLLGGGEKGAEVVSGEKHLISLINDSVSKAINDKLGESLNEIVEMLSNYLPECANTQVVLDGGALVGGTVAEIDRQLGTLYTAKNRGGRSTW